MRLLLIGHGYVGSYLRTRLLDEGHDVDVCDEDPAALAGVPNSICRRYQWLTEEQIDHYQAILWFAGHSSVPKSLADPDGAVANNCLDLLGFARMRPSRARLIYASTASVYSLPLHCAGQAPPPELSEDMTLLNPLNAYDCSKISFDALARCFAENLVGLRLGTVCGMSPNLRPELIFNAMNISAMSNGFVRVSNHQAMRNILFLDNLADYVCRIVKTDAVLPTILNVGSMNVSIGSLADRIAAFHGVPIVNGEDSPTYSFRMDCSRLHKLMGPAQDVSLEERCAEFLALYQGQHLRAAS